MNLSTEELDENQIQIIQNLSPVREKILKYIAGSYLIKDFSDLINIIDEYSYRFRWGPQYYSMELVDLLDIFQHFGIISVKEFFSLNGVQLEQFLFSEKLMKFSEKIHYIYSCYLKIYKIEDKIIEEIPNMSSSDLSHDILSRNPYYYYYRMGQPPYSLEVVHHFNYNMYDSSKPREMNERNDSPIWANFRTSKERKANDMDKKKILLSIINDVKKIFKDYGLEKNFKQINFSSTFPTIDLNYLFNNNEDKNPLYVDKYTGEVSYTPIVCSIDIRFVFEPDSEASFGRRQYWPVPCDSGFAYSVKHIGSVFEILPPDYTRDKFTCNYCRTCKHLINCCDECTSNCSTASNFKCFHSDCECENPIRNLCAVYDMNFENPDKYHRFHGEYYDSDSNSYSDFD